MMPKFASLYTSFEVRKEYTPHPPKKSYYSFNWSSSSMMLVTLTVTPLKFFPQLCPCTSCFQFNESRQNVCLCFSEPVEKIL